MKTTLVIFLLASINCLAQADRLRSNFSDPIEIKNTPYIVTSKTTPPHYGNNTLVFINTSDGTVRNVDLPNLVVIQEIKNFQSIELGINVIFVSTISKTGQKSSIYNRFFVLSGDGLEQKELEVEKELINQYIFNSTTGRVTFFLNGSSLKEGSKNEQIAVFDLKSLIQIN